MIDYARELETLRAEHGWVICDAAIRDTRRLRWDTPHLARCMGEVWTALDAWVPAGRPVVPSEPRLAGREDRRVCRALARVLVRYHAAAYWRKIGGWTP